MSLTNKDQVFPLKLEAISNVEFAKIVAHALREDFKNDSAAVKAIGGTTKISLRAIKNWYEGRSAPSSGHLLLLCRRSPTLLKFMIEQIGGGELWDVFQLFMDVYDKNDSVIKHPIYRDICVPINVPIKLNQRQKYFLILLKSGKKGTAEDIANRWQVTVKTAKRDILKLKDTGRIRFEGARKTGHYKIIDPQ